MLSLATVLSSILTIKLPLGTIDSGQKTSQRTKTEQKYNGYMIILIFFTILKIQPPCGFSRDTILFALI